VNHILKGDHGMIIAVIENEFGAVSIDDALVGENMKEKARLHPPPKGFLSLPIHSSTFSRNPQPLNLKNP
jgi:hypothetical protein